MNETQQQQKSATIVKFQIKINSYKTPKTGQLIEKRHKHLHLNIFVIFNMTSIFYVSFRLATD